MKQSELNRQVAAATGESVATIKRLGFLLDEPMDTGDDPDDESLGPHIIDWDALAVQRQTGSRERISHEPMAA